MRSSKRRCLWANLDRPDVDTGDFAGRGTELAEVVARPARLLQAWQQLRVLFTGGVAALSLRPFCGVLNRLYEGAGEGLAAC